MGPTSRRYLGAATRSSTSFRRSGRTIGRFTNTEAEEVRAEHVHRLGNLTLLTQSLNSKVSNGPWASKREALRAHDTLLLNSRLLSTVDGIWDEAGIDSRTDAMIDVLLATWPVPDGHEGIVVDPHEKSAGWIQIKHLVDAGLLAPGTALTSRPGTWGTGTAVVRPDGLLEVDGKTFESPSGAGRYVKRIADERLAILEPARRPQASRCPRCLHRRGSREGNSRL